MGKHGTNYDEMHIPSREEQLSELELVYGDLRRAQQKIKLLHDALELTQFGFNHARCPVCAGWNMGPNGETDRVHTPTCPVGVALGANG